MELYQELEEKTRQLDASVRRLRRSGTEFAEAEMNYKIKLRENVLKQREEGMAVGIINMVVYGVPEVAKARLDRDIKQTVYEANKEAINALKLQIRLIDAQLQREWTS